jgi:ribosomal-protein-alanine N-acetyltransferase
MMKNISIRHANARDLDGLVKLEEECFTTDKMSRKNFQHSLKTHTSAILVMEKNSDIIGSAVIFFRKNSPRARLYSFAIHHTHRAQGLAIELAHHLEKVAAHHGCSALILEVNTHNSRAINFYEKNGYKKSGTLPKFYEDGSDALRMIKNIL